MTIDYDLWNLKGYTPRQEENRVNQPSEILLYDPPAGAWMSTDQSAKADGNGFCVRITCLGHVWDETLPVIFGGFEFAGTDDPNIIEANAQDQYGLFDTAHDWKLMKFTEQIEHKSSVIDFRVKGTTRWKNDGSDHLPTAGRRIAVNR